MKIWDENLLYIICKFLNCSCEIYFEANLRLDIFELQLVKGFMISLKKFHGNSFFYFWLLAGRKKNMVTSSQTNVQNYRTKRI